LDTSSSNIHRNKSAFHKDNLSIQSRLRRQNLLGKNNPPNYSPHHTTQNYNSYDTTPYIKPE